MAFADERLAGRALRVEDEDSEEDAEEAVGNDEFSSRELRRGLHQKLGRRLSRRMRWAVFMALLGVFVVLLARFACVYIRGSAAADAAMEEMVDALEVDVDATFDGGLRGAAAAAGEAERLQERAGRGSVMLRPTNTPEDWAEKLAGEDALSAEDLDIAQVHRNLTRPGKAADMHWGDVWIMEEINQALEVQIDKINDQMYEIVQEKMAAVKLPRTQQLIVDGFYGLETLYIDEARCYDVHSDLENGIAKIFVKVRAHTSTMDIRGRFRPGKRGAYYSFKLLVYGFTAEEDRIEGEFLYEDRSVPRAKIGWVKTWYRNLDGTCYQKNHPDRKDKFCTDVMNKKLQQKKGEILHKLSSKLTSGIQAKVDSMLPFKMGKKKQEQEQRES
eukprot:TRINITY_DN16385_c1_g2_i1.p1 TRINITY_DN16385_c1_g2~~TRINITY_DN16385_c1_g2_i1.p1  ORF type:complete len:387 (-),score=112.71 TRINITY_DN16385_c1_g2_i1:76-1236(-)